MVDPRRRRFAPAKFYVYVAVPPPGAHARTEMTTELYVTFDGTDGGCDGYNARTHLTQCLTFGERRSVEVPGFTASFERWLEAHWETLTVHRDGPVFLIPPSWWR